MSSLTQGIINQKLQDTVDDKNNSWLQSYERNIFFVCVRWTSGTEAAAAVFGSWQTAGTADISFILKEKKNMFPLTIIKAQHELFTLEEQCNISCIESWLCWLLYINYKVICSLNLSCCYLRNQSCDTHDDVQYLIYETWNQRQKTVKPLCVCVSGWGGYGECVISSELLQPQRTACSRQIQPQTRGKSYSMSHVQIIVCTRFVKMMMIKESKSPSDCLHKNCNTFC